MSDFVLDRHASSASSRAGFPPVKPQWLTPATVALVGAVYLVAALLMLRAPLPGDNMVVADELSLDLMPEGDMFESQASTPADEAPPPQQMSEAAIEIPAPAILDPDAEPAAEKQQAKPEQSAAQQQQSEAQDQHRLGMKGGRAQSAGVSKVAYAAMLAQAVRRHVSSHSSPGAGVASCNFQVEASGALSVVSCSGTSSKHQAVLRAAIVATKAPPPPEGGFFASQRILFQ